MKDLDLYLDFSEMGSGMAGFDSLYYKYHQAVYANILKMVREPAVAEDLLQDVFLALWEHHTSIESNRVANWLFVVSYNKSLTFLKKLRRSPVSLVPEIAVLENIASSDLLSEEDFLERLAMVEEAIALLPERKKEIFYKYRFEGIPLQEIASLLNISVHTVKDHLKVATKFIREYMTEKSCHPSNADLLLISLYFSL
ncbi:RNA polymerase sigma factor [Telluribacter sp. SYSU D00476]|uniref:RNA polymerase sigma factor n=1 Tax=Telluribacter sp. SYSU D00476 TaxID=2811430 RepID=UPI001FF2332F|nr:sigma-70 family RNA polymerase sigma factor [Telluribacter sp. SYSU D00476]